MYGGSNHEEFIDWLNQVERIFDFHEAPDSKKVKLISIKLRGRASACGNSSKFKELGGVKERSKIGAR